MDNNAFMGLRLATNEIKALILQKQLAHGVSNDAMCIILRDVLSDYEAGTAFDYARALAQEQTNKPAEQSGGNEDDNTEHQA